VGVGEGGGHVPWSAHTLGEQLLYSLEASVCGQRCRWRQLGGMVVMLSTGRPELMAT
jgi:hypothetical protein